MTIKCRMVWRINANNDLLLKRPVNPAKGRKPEAVHHRMVWRGGDRMVRQWSRGLRVTPAGRDYLAAMRYEKWKEDENG